MIFFIVICFYMLIDYIMYYVFRNEQIETRFNFKNTYVKNLSTSNQTKSLLKNSNNNSNMQPTGNGLKSQQNKSSTIIFPNSIEKIQIDTNNKFVPEKHITEKCSTNGSICENVENYPR